MKYIFFIFLVAVGFESLGQKKTKTTIYVDGVCDMCKKRIENALDVRGILFAEWDKNSHLLTVVYRQKNITEDSIHRIVNSVGHDTERSKAPDEVYWKLADCCHYRDEENIHRKRSR